MATYHYDSQYPSKYARPKTRKPMRAWLVVCLDVLAICVAMGIFELYHHVLPRPGVATLKIVDMPPAHTSSPYTYDTAGAPTQASANNNAEITVTSAQAPADDTSDAPAKAVAAMNKPVYGSFMDSFPNYDTGVGADLSYQSDTIRIAIRKYSENGIAYQVADIWINDISSFRTAFAKDQYGIGIHDGFLTTSRANEAIVSINGDYYGARQKGVVIRNGMLYRDSVNGDVCVLYEDGVMETYTASEFNINDAVSRKAVQAWNFGPHLLEGGQPMTKFNSTVGVANPRAAIGYYEPGHYCFVTVDGRQAGYSKGMTMTQLSQLFYDLGCVAAYNLDGGQTAMMAFQGELVNKPYNGGRPSSDIIYIK